MTYEVNEVVLKKMTDNILVIAEKQMQEDSIKFALFLKRHETSLEHIGRTEITQLYILHKKELTKAFKDKVGDAWLLYPESLPKKKGEYKYWVGECLDKNYAYRGKTKKEVKDLITSFWGEQKY